jgi:hypothetical protein
MFERFVLTGRLLALPALLALLPAISQAQDVYYADWAMRGVETDISPHADLSNGFFAIQDHVTSGAKTQPTNTNYTFGTATNSVNWALLATGSSSATENGSTDVGSVIGTRHVSSDTTVNDVTYTLGGLSFSADSLTSHSEASGKRGSFTSSSSGSWVNTNLTVNGTAITIPQSGGPNDLIYNQDGLQVWLNRSVTTNTSTTGFSANSAVEFDFNGFLASNSNPIYGYAQFGASDADLHVAPEPASMFGLATLAGGFLLRRRRSAKN